MPRRALILSPTPTHPADHGHRNRVRQMARLLRETGYVIDFVLYPMDDDWRDAIPPDLALMQAEWGEGGGHVTVVPPSVALHAAARHGDHTIDEWWDEALDAQLAFLCRRRAYDAMLVNYVFLSRAFRHAAPGCRKLLDTHDCLSGRRALFERHGAPVEFFHTTEAEEAIALARADVVIAIKESEAETFRRLTSCQVIALPFFPSRRASRAAARDARRGTLRVGFIGADNSVNAHNLRAFLRRLAAWRALHLPDLEVVVAGNVCRRIAPAPAFVTLLARVVDTADFYASLDVVVAPLEFSTGLKIKVAEALAQGVAVVATADAFDGFAPADAFHALPDIEAVCAALMALAADPKRLAALTRASRVAAEAARRAVAHGAAALEALLTAPRPVLEVMAAPDSAGRATLAAEAGRQAIAYFADAADLRGVPGTGSDPAPAPAAAVAARLDLRGDAPVLHAGGEGIAPASARPPPLRHLPAALAWSAPAAGPPFALIVVEQDEHPEENAARETLARALRSACAGSRTAILRTADAAHDPAFLARLAALPSPHLLAAVDPSAAACDLLGCLARAADAAFVPLGGPYPMLAGVGPGRLVRNLREHIAAAVALLAAPGTGCQSAGGGDVGWSLLWAALQRPVVLGAATTAV